MSPRETLNYFLDRFCSNLNCVTSFCPTHCACFNFSPTPLALNEHIAVQVRTPVPVAPSIDPEKLGEAVMEPCGRNCFMHPTTGDSAIVRPPVAHNTSSPKFHGQGSLWTPTDIETLHVTLDYAPDTLPCDLAVIVRKPCCEVRHPAPWALLRAAHSPRCARQPFPRSSTNAKFTCPPHPNPSLHCVPHPHALL